MSGSSLRLESFSLRLNLRERADIRLGGFHLMLKVGAVKFAVVMASEN